MERHGEEERLTEEGAEACLAEERSQRSKGQCQAWDWLVQVWDLGDDVEAGQVEATVNCQAQDTKGCSED